MATHVPRYVVDSPFLFLAFAAPLSRPNRAASPARSSTHATARRSRKCRCASTTRRSPHSPPVTDAFSSTAFPPAAASLYVSSVDYILVRRFVDVPAGDVLDITIPIAAGTGTYAETVNVSGGAEANAAPSQQVLRSNELQQLRGVITNDPMRAIHVLPGVATGDDLRSEFSVRGLPVRNMNFTFEGIATPLLVHTVQGVQDTGSIAMVNGDVLNEIALAAGSYPQRYGNHTGAELNFLMREGSRDRLRGQFRPSITDTSLVLEGPLGSSKSGSWLVSARKSYLGSVIRRIDPGKHVRVRVPRRAGEARARRHAGASAAVRAHRRPLAPGSGSGIHRPRRSEGWRQRCRASRSSRGAISCRRDSS